MSNEQPIAEKSISERIPAIWAKLSRNQRRFVIAMLESPTKKEAAEAIGMSPDTVYRWPDEVFDAIAAIEADRQASAISILAANVPKAAMVKTAGLDSDNEKIRQDSATEVLDRVLGKPMQRSEVTGGDGAPVPITIVEIIKPSGD